jgi:hypothetical protein
MKLNKIGYGMIKYAYDTNKYRFREMVSELFGVGELERVHEIKPELVREEYRNLNIHNENTTDFHDIFYKKLNDNWTDLYEAYDDFIQNEIVPLVDEKFHYQYLPSFRIQLPYDNQAIHTWHYDSDQLHGHPIGEINFWLPLTKCYDTNTMWVESEQFKLDFKSLDGNYGDFWSTNANVCIHGNKPNITNSTRMSFDFRVIPLSKFDESNESKSVSKSNKFVVGSYYKEL